MYLGAFSYLVVAGLFLPLPKSCAAMPDTCQHRNASGKKSLKLIGALYYCGRDVLRPEQQDRC
jgi:hypothetical protein